jgi:flagellar basal-body rod modification protein FlgD
MTITSPVSATPITSVIGAPTIEPTVAPKDTLGKDAFLKLLVAQLRYQDPSNPTDSSQFMSQTAQFTQVEKLDQIAKANTDMLAAQNLFASSALVGRTVTYTGADGVDVSGVVTAAVFGVTGPVLRVGSEGTEVPVSAVKEIRQT